MRDIIQEKLALTERTLNTMGRDVPLLNTIEQVARTAVETFRAGGKLLIAGNGGSAADAQHIAAELVVRFTRDRPGLPAIALTTDTSALTATANDLGFDRLFSRQVEALGAKGDLFVGISTSGRSGNILAALERAKEKGLVTVGMTGANEGAMAPLCDHLIRVPSTVTANIQEGHITVGHILCGLIETELFPQG